MTKTAIKVQNLSKRYYLRNNLWQNGTLRDLIMMPFGRSVRRSAVNSGADILWALKDVSFSLNQGETLGIIGNNGAGKSTLLKILSRITKPSAGCAELAGRVGSLLEVGTGFHPELSGRENVFLNGAILGMKRREIERKFDEIVAFAEVEDFLETPVKHYSSGMFMRLAFSVAAHLEPEILIVDEVLAVGDMNFQHKCLDKMQNIMQRGHTILFVSHNMSAVTRLCQNAIALHKGQIISQGETNAVISEYTNSSWGLAAEKIWEVPDDAPQSEAVRLRHVRVINEHGEKTDTIDLSEMIGIEMSFDVLQSGHILIPNYHFYNQERTYLFALQDTAGEWRSRPREAGSYTTTAWLPKHFFNEGTLIVEVAVSSHVPVSQVHFRTGEAVRFEAVDKKANNLTRGDFTGRIAGLIRPLASWNTEFESKHG